MWDFDIIVVSNDSRLPVSTCLHVTPNVISSKSGLFLHPFEPGLALGLLRPKEWGGGGSEQVLEPMP